MVPGIVPFLLFLAALSSGTGVSLDDLIDGEIESLLATYRKLHAAPELSGREEKTSAALANRLRALGYDVTERVGRYEQPGAICYGVVGVMENGKGPVVLVRTDLDALPVEEKTGLPYASRVKAVNADGEEVSVMHACGHDIHMTSFLGTATLLARLKDEWRGTLVLVGQPAEEIGAGARAMLADGLYARFPRPDFALALHDDASLEAGKVGCCAGHALASVDSVDLTIRGAGGHGAYPHATKDPVVVAAQVVMALQTIVSREISPLDPAVVTVGSIHGGSKHNIIPDDVLLQLTVRAYRSEVREKVLEAIGRVARGTAAAAGIPEDRAPLMSVNPSESTPSTWNDPGLTRRLVACWQEALGKENVVERDPVMAGEDFSRYSLEGHEIPACLFWLGAVDPSLAARSREEGSQLPSLHSPLFAPHPEPTIRTGVKAMTAAVLHLMESPI